MLVNEYKPEFYVTKVRKMQNLGSVYNCGCPFVMSRTDAQNGLDLIFKEACYNPFFKDLAQIDYYKLKTYFKLIQPMCGLWLSISFKVRCKLKHAKSNARLSKIILHAKVRICSYNFYKLANHA